MHEYRQANVNRYDERDVLERDDRVAVSGPEQRSQVPEEVERLGKAVARVREAIEHLQERLACVSVPIPQVDAGPENLKVRATLCPLAERIGDEARRVEDGATILGQLLRTLAL